jgi:hypothetical protein
MDIDGIHTRLNELLFDGGAKKFIKLDNYCEKNKSDNTQLIPILLTERYLDDMSFLEKLGFDINKKIEDHNLAHLINYPPLIISLDEWEIFWIYAPADKDEAVEIFINYINKWQNQKDKTEYHFSYGIFLAEKLKKNIINQEYEKFFNLKKVI